MPTLARHRVWWMTASTRALAITGELICLAGDLWVSVGGSLQGYARSRFLAYVEEARVELEGPPPAAPSSQEFRDAQHGGGEPLEPYDEDGIAAGRGDR